MIPYRLDLAGGWLDQPYISGIHPGWVITVSIEPTVEYKERCGLATSTRKSLKKLIDAGINKKDDIELASYLFNFDNVPGNKNVSGAQDAIGICVKGLCRHYYNGKYWPDRIEICQDQEVLDWLEKHIFMKLLWPRPDDMDVTKGSNIDYKLIHYLSEYSEKCWYAIIEKNLPEFASYFTRAFLQQTNLFPNMMNQKIEHEITEDYMGYKLAGAGGGGYLIMVNDTPCGQAIKIRRS